MKDRGMIKWQPFDSLTSSKKMVQNILFEKSKVDKPKLSEEQLNEIENRLLEGFHSQIPMRIVYFFKGRYQVKQGLYITDILVNQRKIIFEDSSSLFFDQIIHISSI